jgi:hypothetical protein
MIMMYIKRRAHCELSWNLEFQDSSRIAPNDGPIYAALSKKASNMVPPTSKAESVVNPTRQRHSIMIKDPARDQL